MNTKTGPVNEALWNTILRPLEGMPASAGANGWAAAGVELES